MNLGGSINDTYDFHNTHTNGFKTDALNAYASYYQERGLGKPFRWFITAEELIY